MNQTGLENKAGELMKELDTLLSTSRAARREEVDAKLETEIAKTTMENLQARLYVELSQREDFDWTSPNPVLDADGVAMPEFEAQWRTMLVNTLIQDDQDFVSAAGNLDAAQKRNYKAQQESLQTMTEIGVKKAGPFLIPP